MLLLLLLHEKFQIKDQFEIWQGVTTSRNLWKESGKKKPSDIYKVVNLSGIDNCTGMIEAENLIDFMPTRSIPEDKLLTKYDYLISCKGEVKGFSMLMSENILEMMKKKSCGGLVASNHFLVLRPRLIADAGISEIGFLHNLLGIISAKLNDLPSVKKRINKYVTVNEVSNYTFAFPYKDGKVVDSFNAVFSNYIGSLKDFIYAKERVDEYNRILETKIILPQNE